MLIYFQFQSFIIVNLLSISFLLLLFHLVTILIVQIEVRTIPNFIIFIWFIRKSVYIRLWHLQVKIRVNKNGKMPLKFSGNDLTTSKSFKSILILIQKDILKLSYQFIFISYFSLLFFSSDHRWWWIVSAQEKNHWQYFYHSL